MTLVTTTLPESDVLADGKECRLDTNRRARIFDKVTLVRMVFFPKLRARYESLDIGPQCVVVDELALRVQVSQEPMSVRVYLDALVPSY